MQLRRYQVDAAYFLLGRERAILAYPPGTGKTAIGCSAAVEGPTLIVAPNGPVLHHWQDQMLRWGGRPSALAQGASRSSSIEFVEDGQADVLVTNYECFRIDIDRLAKIRWVTVIFDEAHRLKNRRALVHKAAARIARRTQHMYLLTGTPIINHADEVWSYLHLIDPKKFSSYWRFVDLYFNVVPVRHRGRMVREVRDVRPDRMEALAELLAPHMLYAPIEDLLPFLPEVTETYYSVSLSTEERYAYTSMKGKLWAEFPDGILHAENVAASRLRLRQLASDWSVFNHNSVGTKAQTAVQLINELPPDEKVIVFCAFRNTVDALVSGLRMHGHKAVAYHGGMSDRLRNMARYEFIHGEHRVLVGTIATMGEGVDGLQVARNAIFLDRDWSPARNEQAIGRLRRQGQMHAVNVQHIVAADTVDEDVSAALLKKESVVDALIRRQ